MRCPAVASLALMIISCRRCGWRHAKSSTLTTPLASSRERNAERRPHRARKLDRVFGRAAAVATERSVPKGFTQGCGSFLRVLLFPSPLSSGACVPAVEAQKPVGMGVRSVPAGASKWRPCLTLREQAGPPGCVLGPRLEPTFRALRKSQRCVESSSTVCGSDCTLPSNRCIRETTRRGGVRVSR
jgi:hypothetical protein